MNLDGGGVSLAHVHAYIDGQLGETDCQRLEDYFDTNPEKFELLQQYLAINDHYQSQYDSVLQEAIPQNLLERVFGGEKDLFDHQPDRWEQAIGFLSVLLFSKPSSWSRVSVRRTDSLRGKISDKVSPWMHKLRSVTGFNRLAQASVVTRLGVGFKRFIHVPSQQIRAINMRRWPWLAKIRSSFGDVNLFAATSLLLVGLLIGSHIGESENSSPSNAPPSFSQAQALQAHLLYSKEGRVNLETEVDKQQPMLNRISQSIGRETRLVDLTEMGYVNAGMTLLPTEDAFALVTVYGTEQGQSVTLYISKADSDRHDNLKCFTTVGANNLCGWSDDALQFLIVSDLAVAETRQLAEWMQQNYSMAHLISSNEYFFSHTLGTINA